METTGIDKMKSDMLKLIENQLAELRKKRANELTSEEFKYQTRLWHMMTEIILK